MSIWCSRPLIGTDPDWPRHDDDPPGDVRSYVSGWSNHYPTTDDTAELPAWIDTASIAPWCVPGWGGREDECQMHVGPWLRLSVDAPHTRIPPRTPEEMAEWVAAWESGEPPDIEVAVGPRRHVAVVLDEAAVRSLVDDLLDWLATPKVRPEDTS